MKRLQGVTGEGERGQDSKRSKVLGGEGESLWLSGRVVRRDSKNVEGKGQMHETTRSSGVATIDGFWLVINFTISPFTDQVNNRSILTTLKV